MARIYKGENVVLKGKVTIGDGCSLWHNVVIRGDSGCVHIGENTNIQDLVMIHTGFDQAPVSIGNGVTVGHSAIVHGCTIGNNCLIGMGAIVMNHAVIGDNCIVGAGALVTEGKVFEEGSLIIGSPARSVRKLSEEEKENIKRNASLYIDEAKTWLKEEEYGE